MFKNRIDSAKQLSTKLLDLYQQDNLLVLGISAGGMVVAQELAQQLNVPYDMLTVLKLRVPNHETEPLGAIAIGGETVFNRGIIQYFDVAQDIVSQLEMSAKAKLQEKEQLYRGMNAMPLDVYGKTILLIDDGMSTGVTMRASIDAMKAQSAKSVIVASPVASPQVTMMFQGIADRTTCLHTPRPFQSVAHWYETFDKPSAEHIQQLLQMRKLNPV